MNHFFFPCLAMFSDQFVILLRFSVITFSVLAIPTFYTAIAIQFKVTLYLEFIFVPISDHNEATVKMWSYF